MKKLAAFDTQQVVTKWICSGCVGERFLKALIQAEGHEAVCSYCEDEAKTITIEELADRVERAFENHYERTPTEPEGIEAAMHYDRESKYQWNRRGEEALRAIANAAEIDEGPAEDVLSVLQDRHSDFERAKMGEECEFDSSSYYAERDTDCRAFANMWNEFEIQLKSEARFFSRSGHQTLGEIFAHLQKLKTHEGAPVLVKAGPDTKIQSLHRARVFAGETVKLEEALQFPWKHLGPPPMQAASAGRMNSRGISVFYGATEAETALAEVRPPVGCQVVVAKFNIVRPLQLLDVDALKSVTTPGSVFDPVFLKELERAKFLEILSARISRPVMPSEEALEYLATQAAADYLATEHNLDGIIFPSVQVGHAASNVVLFHKASLVEEVELPDGTDVSIGMQQYGAEGNEPDYIVWETITPQPEVLKPAVPDPIDWIDSPKIPVRFDLRKPSLAIDLESVTVHQIKAVKFTSDPYSVHRHRHTLPEQ